MMAGSDKDEQPPRVWVGDDDEDEWAEVGQITEIDMSNVEPIDWDAARQRLGMESQEVEFDLTYQQVDLTRLFPESHPIHWFHQAWRDEEPFWLDMPEIGFRVLIAVTSFDTETGEAVCKIVQAEPLDPE